MYVDLNNPRTLTEYRIQLNILLPRAFTGDIIITIVFILLHMEKMASVSSANLAIT